MKPPACGSTESPQSFGGFVTHKDANDWTAGLVGHLKRGIVRKPQIVSKPYDYRLPDIVRAHVVRHCSIDPLAVQAPDFEVEQIRERDPCRERHEAQGGQYVQSTEAIDRCEDDQKLRDDIKQTGEWIIQAEEQP